MLTSITLENFRSYPHLKFDLSEQSITLLVGPNGFGKTNFLEAIYILSLGRSFRTSDHTDLINWAGDHCRLIGNLKDEDNEEYELQVFFAKKPLKTKNFKISGVNRRHMDFIGNFPTVLFHPEDLNILYLSPSYRRQYLDTILSQTSKVYLRALSRYKRVLQQKNALLKTIREQKYKHLSTARLEEDLTAWNQQLVDFGAELIHRRAKLLAYLKEKVPGFYRGISAQNEKVFVDYQTKVPADSHENKENVALELAKLIDQKTEIEIISGKALIGPHLDDISFSIQDKEIHRSASRGEFRTLLLAIKMAEIDFIKENTGKIPTLLLDDVFSELDLERQSHLLKIIEGAPTIITTTNLDKSHENLINLPNTRIVQIEDLCYNIEKA